MSACQDKTSLSCSQSRENVSGGEWGRMDDACTSCFNDPTGEAIHAAMDAVQPGIDGHLPLPRGQRELMLGLVEEGFAGYQGRLGSDPDSTDYLDIPGDPNYSESDGNVATKKRNRSNSSRHRGEVVTELGPEEVRWFYKEDKRTWKPFVGHDSLKIELAYRKYCELNPDEVKRRDAAEEPEDLFESPSGCEEPAVRRLSAAVAAQPVPESTDAGCSTEETVIGSDSVNVDAVCVRGGLYEVDIKGKSCYPVYWNREFLYKLAF